MKSLLAPQHVAAGLHAGTVGLWLQMVTPQPPVFAGSWYQRKPYTLGYDSRRPDLWHFVSPSGKENHVEPIRCPFYIGDTLYVRETWQINHIDFDRGPVPKTHPVDAYTGEPVEIIYRADGEFHQQFEIVEDSSGWRPSVHMPEWAVRTRLTVTSIACVRPVDLTEEQAIAKGIEPLYSQHAIETVVGLEPYRFGNEPVPWTNYQWHGRGGNDGYSSAKDARDSFRSLWTRLHGPEAMTRWVWSVGVVKQP